MIQISNILNGLIKGINNLINSIDLRTQETIKRAFMFLIFILCIAGIAIGYNMGVDSAKIKSRPVAEYVNDTFKIDMSREKKNADFSSVLESKIVSESAVNNFKKYDFPIKESNENSFKENQIMENQNNPIKSKENQETGIPLDPALKPKTDSTIVRPIEKLNKEKNDNIIIQKDKVPGTDVRSVKEPGQVTPKIYQENDTVK